MSGRPLPTPLADRLREVRRSLESPLHAGRLLDRVLPEIAKMERAYGEIVRDAAEQTALMDAKVGERSDA